MDDVHYSTVAESRESSWSLPRLALAVLLTDVGYWAGAKLGLALTPGPEPVASLWPPNAVLLASLLIVPVRHWWIILLGALPAHLVVELQGGVPVRMVLSWFVSNAFEAALGAGLVRRFRGATTRIDTARALGVFVLFATFFATFASSFLDAGFVILNRWGESGYWAVWRIRFFSNVLSTQTIVPVILACDASAYRAIRSAPMRRWVEGIALGIATLIVCSATFAAPAELWHLGPALLYAPVPLLLWAAVRFGILGVSISLLGVTVAAIWGVVRGNGPFNAIGSPANAVSVQLFLFLTAVPLLMLATVIQERRRAEEVARQGERLLALTIGAASIGVWSFDVEEGHPWSDGNVEQLHALPPAYGGRSFTDWMQRMHPDDRALVEENFGIAGSPDAPRDEQGDSPIRESIVRVRHADETIHWVLIRGTVLRHPDGTAYRTTGVNIDITERRRIGAALRESNERMELVASTAKIGFWSLELGTDVLWMSKHCYALLGTEGPAAKAREAVESLIRATASREDTDGGVATLDALRMHEYELPIIEAAGTERWIAASARRVRGPGGRALRIIGVIRDITDQRRAEQEVRQRQQELTHLSRVSLVGELAAAIVHEVGQPIGAVKLNAQTAERLLEREDVDHDVILEIVREILRDNQRAWVEIKQLRDLVRRGETERERLDMRQVVREALVLARGELTDEGIDVGLDVADDVPAVMGNKAQLQQVLLNLILNARDAMSDMPPTLRQLRVKVERGEGATAHVELADAGSGISSDNLDSMFEPFVTSKRHGLGLGLAISRSIVVEHGGALRAETGNVGAVLHLTLPSAEAR